MKWSDGHAQPTHSPLCISTDQDGASVFTPQKTIGRCSRGIVIVSPLAATQEDHGTLKMKPIP